MKPITEAATNRKDWHSAQVAGKVVRALNRRYAVVLALVAALVVIDQAVIQPLLVRLNLYAPVINVAGRQRMLSQKVTKAALAYQQAERPAATVAAEELRTALDQWARAHHGLIEGDQQMNLPRTRSPEILAAFERLEPHFQAMRQAATQLVDEPNAGNVGGAKDEQAARLVRTILKHERAYLPVMDSIVGMYEAEARGQVFWLRVTGLAIMVGILLSLSLVGLFMLRPAQHVIRRQVQQIAAGERRYRLLVERMSDGLVIYDADGRITYANGRFCELLATPLEALMGRPLLDLTSDESRAELAAVVNGSSFPSRQVADVYWQSAAADLIATMVCVCHSVSERHPEETRFAVVTDISDRKRAENLLRQSRDQLEARVAERTAALTAANEQLQKEVQERQAAEARTQQLSMQVAHASRVTAIGQLATGLAHELNQPLAAVTNHAERLELLSERGKLHRDELRVSLQGISQAALRAGHIIRRMRNFVRPGGSEPARVDLTTLLREVQELCRSEAARSSVAFSVLAADDLPPVCVDAIQIQQVLVNLIQNAIQAMSDCPRDARHLRITARAQIDVIEVEVSDTGLGLSSATAEEIFAPFYTTKSDGLGMGLAICHSIVRRHGGRLWAENRPDGGAVVTFTLPVMRHDEQGSDAHADSLCRR